MDIASETATLTLIICRREENRKGKERPRKNGAAQRVKEVQKDGPMERVGGQAVKHGQTAKGAVAKDGARGT